MSSFHNNALVGASGLGGYQIERSLRFNSADSAYLNRTPASAGNRKTWTWSGWVKLTNIAGYCHLISAGPDSNTVSSLSFSENGNTTGLNDLSFFDYQSGGYTTQLKSTAIFRDPSSWYHVVLAVDTTQGTAANRIKIYVNGTQLTTFATATYPTQNTDLVLNNNVAHLVGAYTNTKYRYSDAYLTEINFIDGQALTPSSFGETDTITGVWKPKKYAGTYGTNGFYLKFADNSGTTSTTLGKDSSGNGNNWTPNNFSVTAGAGNDSLIDVPTPYADGGNGRGNYCTLNPLDNGGLTLANGNLDGTYTTTAWRATRASIGISSGKWYWEITSPDASTSSSPYRSILTGIAKAGASLTVGVGQDANGWGYFNFDGTKYSNNTSSAYGTSWNSTNTIGVAFDADNGTLTFYRDNTSQGTAFTGLTSGPYFPAVSCYGSVTANLNFGQRSFSYTPPSGFLALNTQNLPEPSIKKPSSYFDAKLYTGTGATLNVTGFGFSPDLVWTKNRSSINNNRLYDPLRGTTKELYSNATDAESTDSNSLTAFNSDGFTLGSSSGTNNSGSSYVAWCWEESATPGFDIVTYTGDGSSARAISHSLGVAPKFVIVKVRSVGGENWNCWHTSLNNTAARILLNTSGAVDTGSPTIWGTGGINPTSTTFQVGSSTGTNGNTYTYVAYLFSEISGFSRFGSYTGNGSSDGPFVFCGFRPRWVLAKRSDASSYNWFIFDAARSPENVSDEWLLPNGSNAEQTQVVADMVSNGFKIRSSLSEFNINGGTYIFAAFAESPFKYSLAR